MNAPARLVPGLWLLILCLLKGGAAAAEPAAADAWEWTAFGVLGYDRLTGDRDPWTQQSLGLRAAEPGHSEYSLELRRSTRFDQAEHSVSGTADFRPRDRLVAGVQVSVAQSPQFSPERAYGMHLGREFGNGWVGDFAWRRADYATTRVETLSGTLEKYVGSFRLAYRLVRAQPDGAPAGLAHVAQLNWYRSDKHSFGFSLSGGEEVETVGIGRILTTDVRGAAVSGRHELTPRLRLDWWAGVHEQGDFYVRQYLGLGIAVRL